MGPAGSAPAWAVHGESAGQAASRREGREEVTPCFIPHSDLRRRAGVAVSEAWAGLQGMRAVEGRTQYAELRTLDYSPTLWLGGVSRTLSMVLTAATPNLLSAPAAIGHK